MHAVPTRRRIAVTAVGAISAAVLAGGCTTTSPASDGITVAAAASLTDVFDDLGAAFGRADGSADGADAITVDSASSSALALRIAEGAPVDVFAAADTATMRRLQRKRLLVSEPRVFARTTLVIVLAPGNPARVDAIDDLTRADVRVATAAPEVPLGRYTAETFALAGLAVPATVTRESNARAVLTKVASGEVDAGIVYRPDAGASVPALQTIELPPTAQVTVEYPIAVPATTDDRAGAEAFVRFVLSAQGRAILAAAGYEVP